MLSRITGLAKDARRGLRREWTRITAWVMVPVMLFSFDSFYQVVLAKDAPPPAPRQDPPPPPPPPASANLAGLVKEIRATLGTLSSQIAAGADTAATVATLSTKRDALLAMKPSLDSELAAQLSLITARGLGSEFTSRHSAFASAFNSKFDALSSNLAAVISGPTAANVGAAVTQCDTLIPPPGEGLNTTQMPHRATAMHWQPAGKWPRDTYGIRFTKDPSDTLRNIHAGGIFPTASGPPVPADLAATPEAPTTGDIAALAAALGNDPVRIYEFVRNSIRFEPSYGSVKGARETLRARSGNDTDQASLLVALLRAAGVPSRWVYGTVEIGVDDLASWLDVQETAKALSVLTKNDVPFEPVFSGSVVVRVKLDHTWVRAFVDYVPHRGIGSTPGDRFVDLDPSLKRNLIGAYNDAAAAVGFDAGNFLAQIKARPGTVINDAASFVQTLDDPFIQSELADFGAQLDTYLAANGATALNAFRTVAVDSEEFGVLPASRRYKVTAEGAAYSTLPAPFRTKLKIEVLNADGSVAASNEAPTLERTGRLTVSYRAATTEDQSAITAAMGDTDFPAFLVNVKASFRVDGVEVFTGPSVAMGTTQKVRVTWTRPLDSLSSSVESQVVAGAYTAVALDLGRIGAAHLAERRTKLAAAIAAIGGGTPPEVDEIEGEILQSVGFNFFFQADTLNDISANALSVVWQREAGIALVSHNLTVTTLFDAPFTARADSVSIDVRRDVVLPVSLAGSTEAEKQFLLTSGFTTSALEGTSLNSFFLASALSTVLAFRQANLEGKKTFTATAANVATVLAQITHPADVEAEIAAIAGAGFTVTVPESTVALGTRNVSAFIVVDPLLASSAFVIKASPFIAGGITLTEQVKAGGLLSLGPSSFYSSILTTGEAWFRSVAAATAEVGLEYIPAISSINTWFGGISTLDLATTLASAIAISGPLSFIANQPGIFNVEAGPDHISPSSSPGSQDVFTVTATVTRNAAWTVKFFRIPTDGSAPIQVGEVSGTTADVLATFSDATQPDGDYTFRIEAATGTLTASPRGGTFKVDNTVPVALITAPTAGSTVGGLGVAIRGTATDANFDRYILDVYETDPTAAVTLAESTVQKVAPQLLAPFNSQTIESGTRTFRLQVFDKAGNTAPPQTVTVSIANAPFDSTPPSVTITSPSPGSAVSGTITVAVTATDDFGILQVRLFVDGTLVGVDSTAPYTFTLDTRTLANGAHTIVAEASDTGQVETPGGPALSRIGTSAPVTITTGNIIRSFGVTPNPFTHVTTPGFNDVATTTFDLDTARPWSVEFEPISGGTATVLSGGDVEYLQVAPEPPTVVRRFTGFGAFGIVPWNGQCGTGPDLTTPNPDQRILESGEPFFSPLLDVYTPDPTDLLAGTYRLRVKAFAADGITVVDTAETILIAGGVNAPPVIVVHVPEKDGEVKAPTAVRASIVDQSGDLASWTVELRLEGATTGTVLATGSGQVQNSTVATIDPTLLENDFYEIRITAVDSVGQSTLLVHPFAIVGQNKVGITTYTFTDMAVPVKGIPLTVTRTYDSRLSGIAQDYGPGWRMDVVAGRLKVRANLDVMITLPDNRRTRFKFAPVGTTDSLNNFTQGFLGGVVPPVHSTYVTVAFEAERTQPRWTCRVLGDQDLIRVPTDVEPGPAGGVIVTAFQTFTYDFTPVNETTYSTFIISDQFGTEYHYDRASGRLLGVRDPRDPSPTGTFTVAISNSDVDGDGDLDLVIGHLSAGSSIVAIRDSAGRILELRDPDYPGTNPDEHRLVYTYTGGLLTKSKDRAGNETEYQYTPAGRLDKIIDPRGIQAVQHTYDADGRLISVTDANGKTVGFEHNIAGSQEIVTDRRGNIRVLTYDEDGNVLSDANALGQATVMQYDAAGNEILRRDPLGNETRQTWDARGNLLSRTDALGRITRFDYNGRGQVVATTDALGRITQNEFSDVGDLIRTTDALGNQTVSTYGAFGLVVSTTDALGTRTEFSYNSKGYAIQQRVLSASNVLLRKTDFTFDNQGRQLTQTRHLLNAAGGTVALFTSSTEYDGEGRVKKVTDPLGFFTETLYNEIGQQDTVTDKRGNSVTFEYDDQGRLKKTNFPAMPGIAAAVYEEVFYDDEGNQTGFRDRNGNTSSTEFDAVNRPFKSIHPDGKFRTTSYDAAGRVVAETDERGFTTTLGHDAAGRRVSVTDPLGRTTAFEFDELGRQVAMVDALGRRFEFGFDALGRHVLQSFPDGTSRSVEFDALGRRIAEVDELGLRTEFEYLPTGELHKVKQPDPTNAFSLATITTYNFDSLGRKTQQVDALGRTTGFTYTSRDELETRTLPLGQVESMTWDEQGNLSTRTDFNGLVTSHTYNAHNLLETRSAPGFPTHTFIYFAGGQRKQISIGSDAWTFTIDGRNRLGSQTNPDSTKLEWEYDDAGNRARVKVSRLGIVSQDIAYTWTPRNELHEVFRNGTLWARYAYDAVGNRQSLEYVANGTKQVLGYNLKNQLLTIENQRTLIGTTNKNYLLDPDLVSAWRLNESGAPFADEKLVNPLNAQGAGTASATGNFGGGVAFGSGQTSWLSTTSATPGDARFFPASQGTLVAHYKPAAGTVPTFPSGENPAQVLSDKANEGEFVRHEFRRNPNGTLSFGQSGFTPLTTPVGAISWDDTQFHALAFRWNNAAVAIPSEFGGGTIPAGGAIYEGGVQKTSGAGFDPIVAAFGTVNRFVVGNLGTVPASGSHGARGTLDEVALFKRALSPTEIADIAIRGLTPVIDVPFSSYTYTVDARGLRTHVVELDGRQVDYAYDNLRRLKQEKITHVGGAITQIDYALDLVGNRLSKLVTEFAPGGAVTSTQTTSYVVDANDRLTSETTTSVGTTTYTYSDNGETLTKAGPGGAFSYSWDFDGRMVTATTPTESLTFAYDVDGIRWKKTVSGVATHFVVDKNRDFGQVLEERNAAGAIDVLYVYGDDLISQERAGTGLRWYHFDGQMSARQLSDISANITDTYCFDAFGVTLAQTGTTPNFYLYRGEQLEATLGFYYLRARYLHHRAAVFASSDPAQRFATPTDSPMASTDDNAIEAILREAATPGSGGSSIDDAGESGYIPPFVEYGDFGETFEQNAEPVLPFPATEEALAEPETLHTHLYAGADPVNRSDPSGAFLLDILVTIAIRLILDARQAPAGVGAIATAKITKLLLAWKSIIQVARWGKNIRGYAQLLARAAARYPHLRGSQLHHIFPQAITRRLAAQGIRVPSSIANQLVKLPSSYHRVITNVLNREIRGRTFRSVEDGLELILKVYRSFPLP